MNRLKRYAFSALIFTAVIGTMISGMEDDRDSSLHISGLECQEMLERANATNVDEVTEWARVGPGCNLKRVAR